MPRHEHYRKGKMPYCRTATFFALLGAGVSVGVTSRPAASEPNPQGSIQQVYAVQCAPCHGATMSGGQFGPALNGAAFIAKWTGKPKQLLDYMRQNMPPGMAGSLSMDEYADLAKLLEPTAGPGGAQVIPAPTMQPTGRNPTVPDSFPQHVGPIPAQSSVFADDHYRHALAVRQEILSKLTPVTDDMLTSPSPQDWLTWRRSSQNQGHSPLKQIDRASVSKLTLAWSWSLPISTNQIAPLVHDGVMFVWSAAEVQALDAATGTLLWRYVRDLPTAFRGNLASLRRSVALYGDNLYLSTNDRHVIALEAKTGKLVWDTEIIKPEDPVVLLSAGPVAARGKIIQSVSGGVGCKAGCSIIGLDAKSGQRTWEFRTIAAVGQPGGDSWNGAPDEQRFGGAVWVPGSYDTETGLVYYGTAGSYYVSPLLINRQSKVAGNNDALFTNSTIALDPDTGRLAWYHQHMPREIWDLDEAFERSLIDVPVNGRLRKLVVETGKMGIMDALDRNTGEFVFAKDLGFTNLVSSIDAKTGRRSIKSSFEPVSGKPFEICPSPGGARNWMAIAYNPSTKVMFLPMEETCMTYRWNSKRPEDAKDIAIDIAWTTQRTPGADGNYARLEAVDMTTRKTLWVRRSRAPLSSSLLATDGGILFEGDRDRNFRAVDDRSGETLWQTRLSAAPNASPVTYSVNGRQFVAISTGGGGPHDAESIEITPEIDSGTAATTMWVFALPER
ncbi:PQQ-binding-like beta-propeller repeat protein [soil metagenome]